MRRSRAGTTKKCRTPEKEVLKMKVKEAEGNG